MTRSEKYMVSNEEIEKQKVYIKKIKRRYPYNKNYSISTFGCQMNEHDSEKLLGMLISMGYSKSTDLNDPDIIIYNTCCVRENAEEKVFGHLGALKKMKKENPNLVIAVCGCMMQQSEIVQIIKKKYKHVDLIFGTHNLYKFPELLYNVLITQNKVIDVWDVEGHIAENMPIYREDAVRAWVNIMYGCNNYCSYCIVPYVRGRERSRNYLDIIEEVKSLGASGFKEITVLGQNVNSYGNDLKEGKSFKEILELLNSIDGIQRIRFMTSHPKDLKDELIDAVATLDKVCKHIHLPLQSGSTEILSKMNRKYTKEQYLDLVHKIKNKIPEVAITTDIIVGFPGETEKDFEETLDVVKKARFDMAYTFLYSKRTGTPAKSYENQVPSDVMKDRFDRLLEVQNAISKKINRSLVGKEYEVLVEGPSKSNQRRLTGRTMTNKIVNFDGEDNLIGSLVNVKIQSIQTWSLEGSII